MIDAAGQRPRAKPPPNRAIPERRNANRSVSSRPVRLSSKPSGIRETFAGIDGSTAQSLRPNRVTLLNSNPCAQPRNPCAVQPRNPCAPKEQGKEQQQQQQPLRVREASDLATTTPAAAALPCSSTSPSKTQTARHTCPKCERTWPKEHGPVCYACQFDVERAQRQQELLAKTLEDDRLFEEAHPPAPPPPPPPISQTAKRISHATRTALPESWLHHQDLKQLIDGQDFKEVCETIEGMSRLPPPESFFKDYSQYRQKYNMVEAEIKAGIEAMTDPKRWRVEKSQAA